MRIFKAYVAKRWMITYSRIVLMHDQDRAPFIRMGFECHDNRTHIVNLLLDEKELLQRLKGKCRNKIKRAERAGVTTEIVQDDQYLNEYYDVLLNLYRRQNRAPPSPRSFFQNIWDRFGPAGNLVWVVAKHENALVAGALLGAWKGGIFYIDGVSGDAHKNLGASNLLHWAGMKWAKANNYQFYDFVGSNIPRFALFKGSFGGDLVTYLTLEQANPPWVRKLRERYADYKGFVYRMNLRLQSLKGTSADRVKRAEGGDESADAAQD
jgi:hypothetical protein